MFFNKIRQENVHLQEQLELVNSVLASISQSMATIEFSVDGHILEANELLLSCMEYQKSEIIGQHHRIFCFDEDSFSSEYKAFWSNLARGEPQKGTFRRKKKSGELVWLEATYFPVKVDGKVEKVMKIASDVTEQTESRHYMESVLSALDRSLAIIEFQPDGKIIRANDNFLNTVGYRAEQLRGQHHRMFCDQTFIDENPTFWADLARGETKSGRFLRLNSYGEQLWLEATYNPILDQHGKVTKVIKFASDVSEQEKKNIAVNQATEIAYSTSVETAQIAKEGAQKLSDSVAVSEQISGQVQDTATKIRQLNDKSQSIEEIVSTIQAIAEQTNLLALNAAIEAARAGDQGRGFAVVADEVRQLASRTAESTAEITEVVTENKQLTQSVTTSMEEVIEISDRGVNMIVEASSVMDEIYKGAENVSQTVNSLSDS
ncbi:Biofilm dispersion protein BdlA [Vibrio aerogenes CECT 7868]|uniref:Biofilm dispersion protein BdlA n=1 Tax=Vibrio aerogenes CECT 7868 TaxID=1216006 RepID=A0A1M5ZU46_9VIBR|nr:methyl-accepting chemotaxis protein [Vibrio aerogenes]SHI27732.1 Biofilm dispersion protein BdlA [Vibrio aerogenes CECT 7868]